MINNCDFILGENDSIVIVVPVSLPKGEPLTCEVHKFGLVFRSGDHQVGNIDCERQDVLQRLVTKAKVGLIEFINGVPKFPVYISSVANIEVMAA
ncbi:MAG: hypothetical protein DI586_02640 [Micavibrio aeruginosavorus]|uniref:Uncharacterized protein n=1 Tax=Micavibrio aeruginosavorus TaxID=349221 RepID=A0A2W5FP47_9BACT|nr:MAG: hypothetical protein DI586_02640 [Micavibrio aeruginosavorus]